MEQENSSSILKNPLISSSNSLQKDKNIQQKNGNYNIQSSQNLNNNQNQNVSQQSNNLNTSITTDTIKILTLLRTQPNNNNNNHPSSIPEYSYDDIKGICLRVFMLYAKPKNGQFYLSYINLFKILRSSGIINETSFTTKDADIITQKINKGISQFTSDNFLNFLTRVCSAIDSEFYNDKKGSFINFVKNYLEPLITKIENKNDFSNFTPMISSRNPNGKNFYNEISKSCNLSNSYHNSNSNKINLNITVNFQKFIENYVLDENSYLILTSISPGLKQIYQLYFKYELNRHHDFQKIERGSFKSFIEFSKDFQIMPYLITKNNLEFYWSIVLSYSIEQLINNSTIPFDKFNEEHYKIGTIYTFPKFLLFFAHIAAFYYNDIQEDISNGEKLLYLIEIIYHSRGYANLNKKTSVPYNIKLTIIPPKEVIELINKKLLEDNEKDQLRNKRKYTNWHVDIKNFLELNNENYNTLKPHIEKLRNLFGIYSKIGDKLQFGKMSFTNYQKMLTDGGLLYFRKNKNLSSTTLSKKKLNLTIYENNTNMGRFSNSTFNFNLNTSIHGNNNQLLSKSMSQQIFSNKNFFDSTLMNNSTIKKFTLEPPKNKSKLSISDINLIYSKISGFINFNSSQGKYENKIYRNVSLDKSQILNISTQKKNGPFKLDFFLFMKTLPLIALRFYPNDTNNINEAMATFLEKKFPSFMEKISNIAQVYSDNSELVQLLEQISKNEMLTQLKKDISSFIQCYYKHYSEFISKKKRMTFENFIFFFKDFNIYPHWMSLVNLKEIFYGEISRKNSKNEDTLDFHSFLDCLMIIGICMNSGDDFGWDDKILFMIDKMFAEGGEQTFKKTGFAL